LLINYKHLSQSERYQIHALTNTSVVSGSKFPKPNRLWSLTNNTSLPPLTIAALYKSRWQVELFFKWIKQHLRIKKFLGNSENALKTQIWCAVFTYVLIAIVKKEIQLNASLYTLLQILSVSVFEKTEVSSALQLDRETIDNADNANQLNLFTF
jgi:IS4 transposase